MLVRCQYLRTWRLSHHRLIVIDRPLASCLLSLHVPLVAATSSNLPVLILESNPHRISKYIGSKMTRDSQSLLDEPEGSNECSTKPGPSSQLSDARITTSTHTSSQDELTVYSTEQQVSRSSSDRVSSDDTSFRMTDEANQPLLDEQVTIDPKQSSASTDWSTVSSHSQDKLTVYRTEQRFSQSSLSGAGQTVIADKPNQGKRQPEETTAHSQSLERTAPDQPRISYELSSESTPLLNRRDDDLVQYGTEQRPSRSPSVASRTLLGESSHKKRSRVPWPTVISLVTLTLAVLAILVLAFAAPAAVQEYGQKAAVFKPTAISIDSTTPDGVRARVQGDFVMDSGRVKSKPVRGIGRLATWIAREIETSPSNVEVYLPEYGNVLVGTAAVPTIKLNVRNGHHTTVDFLADLQAGDIQGIHAVAIDWIEGRLGRLSLKGKATVGLKSGLIVLGTQVLTHNVIFEGIAWLFPVTYHLR